MAERRGHKRFRGIAVRVAAFLLLGAVVNVAVAWGFAWFAEGDWSGETSYGITVSERRATEISLLDNVAVSWIILSETQRRAPNHRVSSHGDLIGKAVANAVRHQPRANDVRPDWGHVVQATNEFDELCRNYPDDSVAETQFVIASGWPARSTWCHISMALNGPEHQTVHYGSGALFSSRSANSGSPARLLPIRVLWPGFAINTFFYATILLLLFAFPFTLRRWRRIRRGLCAKCAYPIGTSEVCTECGAQLRTKK